MERHSSTLLPLSLFQVENGVVVFPGERLYLVSLFSNAEQRECVCVCDPNETVAS